MKAPEVLVSARARGIAFWLEDGKLKYRAPTGAMTPDLSEALRAHRAGIVALIDRETIRRIPRTERTPLALSFAQERAWFHEQLAPGSAAYNIPGALRLRGVLDIGALHAAFFDVAARHEILRTRFELDAEGVPRQRIEPSPQIPLVVEDRTGAPPGERESIVQEALGREVETGFDLTSPSLLRIRLVRFAEDDHALLVTMHHIVSDGWSEAIVVKELSAFYAGRLEGRTPALPPLSVQYADFAGWQRAWLSGAELERQLGYWKEALRSIPAAIELPTDRPLPPQQTYAGGIVLRNSGAVLAKDLDAFAQARNLTPFVVLTTAYAVLLARHSGQEDIVVGTPIANRPRPELEQLVGFFVNTLALRVRVEPNASFADTLAQVQRTSLAASAHQDVPFEKVVEAMDVPRDMSRSPIFQAMIAMQNNATEAFALPGLDVQVIVPETAVAKHLLDLEISREADGYAFAWVYNSDLFDHATLSRMAEHFEVLLTAGLREPTTLNSQLPLLGAAERARILIEWNRSEVPFDPTILVHEAFERSADRAPDAIALVDGDRRLTYRELDERSNALARRLRDDGAGRGKFIAVLMSRSSDLVVALLGVMKTGAAYAPIDPNYPHDRISFVLEDTESPVIVASPDVDELIPAPFRERIRRVTDERATERFSALASPDDCAYVIYTSGSTGKPKAVMVEHRNVAALSRWAADELHGNAPHGVTFCSSVCFDMSIFELWCTFFAGGKVLLGQNGLSIGSMPARDEITLLNVVPSVAAELLKLGTIPRTVRVITLCGEPLPAETMRGLNALDHVEKVINLYGPTEDTVFSSGTVTDPSGPVTLGRPLPNTKLYVLDPWMQPVPIGVPGELYIAGAGLSRGYLKRPELTAERFLPNPFPDAYSQRLYRTGDVMRWLPNGELDFVGRVDHQVKFRGFRIELGEIESVLRAVPNVDEAVVVLREDEGGEKRLVGYVGAPGNLVTVTHLLDALRRKVPEYMIPGDLIVLDALPKTPNEKIDRKALPSPAPAKREHVEPRNDLERLLVVIWEEVLGSPGVGITDNFFALGGHSLLVTRLFARVRAASGREPSMTAFFEVPTIEHMAASLGKAWSLPLVALRERAHAPTLLCIHAIGGGVTDYQRLARSVDRGWSVLGLQAPGLVGEAAPRDSIEALADLYEPAMEEARSDSAVVVGWSMGCFVALELAHRLRPDALRRTHFVLIDPPPLDPDERASTLPSDQLVDPFVATWCASLGVPIELANGPASIDALAKALRVTPDEIRHRQNVFSAHAKALARYVPKRSGAKATLLFASDVATVPPGWNDLLDIESGTIVAGSDHYSLVNRHAGDVARRIDPLLRACVRGNE